jgi:hypothetical protein
MCDYSLMAVPNRLAREGENLTVYRFPTGSLGLAPSCDVKSAIETEPGPRTFWAALKHFFTVAPQRPVPAVCIPPGARLMLHDIPLKMQTDQGVGPDEEVVFTQTTAAAHQYRDAVRFQNGRELLLQHLRTGQRVDVLDLSLAREREPSLVEFAESEFMMRRR